MASGIGLGDAAPIQRDGAYAWTVVGLLMVTYTLSFIDRQVLNLLVDPIKRDLLITDTQMSVLQGVAFVVPYLIFGPIFGRLADVGKRRNVIVMGVVTWSLFTMAGGFANSFWTLLVTRMGVGAAEAALAAQVSLISDYFTRDKVPRAISVTYLGPYFGGGLALIFGGLIAGSGGSFSADSLFAGFEKWQATLLIVGAPGILMGAILMLAVREPPRSADATTDGAEPRQYSLREVLASVWEQRGFHLRFVSAWTLITLSLYTVPAWMPSLLIRGYGADPRNVGLFYGTLSLVCGSIGVLTGPFVAAALRRRFGSAAIIWVVVGSGLSLSAGLLALLVSPSFEVSVALAAFITISYSMPQAMAASAVILAVPNRLRAVTMSLYTLTITGFGLGVGPSLVALMTDYVFGGPEQVALSLPIICGGAAILGSAIGATTVPHFRKMVGRA